jgi:nickel/cobalt transporter (NicO) family protein
MSATTPALIAAAAGVGLGHAIMPDHWVPLAVVGRARRYPLARVARLSGLAGVAHVLVSLILGGVIIAVGLQLRSSIEHAQATIVGAVLIATGLAFTVLELTGKGHRHADGSGHGHGHGHGHAPDHHDHKRRGDRRATGGLRGLAAIMVPFGAAASPDLTILPVFLAAATASTAAAVGALIAFSAVTVATILGLTVFATAGGYQIRSEWLDRYGHLFTAAVLLVIGALVVAGIL